MIGFLRAAQIPLCRSSFILLSAVSRIRKEIETVKENTLEEYRLQIDEADRRLIQAFTDRMEIYAEISRYKEAHTLKVFDPVREREEFLAAREKVGTIAG